MEDRETVIARFNPPQRARRIGCIQAGHNLMSLINARRWSAGSVCFRWSMRSGVTSLCPNGAGLGLPGRKAGRPSPCCRRRRLAKLNRDRPNLNGSAQGIREEHHLGRHLFGETQQICRVRPGGL